jgi:riboflavin biosynthesis pyrimidine reductase
VGSVLAERGARLITSLLRARLVDRMAVCIAPSILGAGIEAVGDLGIHEPAGALVLTDARVTRYGANLVIVGHLAYPESASEQRP